MKLVVRGRYIETYIDGAQMNTAEDRIPVIQPFYYTASIDESSGDTLIKLINLQEVAQTVDVCLQGGAEKYNGSRFQIAGVSLPSENALDEPKNVHIDEGIISMGKETLLELPPHSVTVYRIATSDDD